ncbi:MAG: ECF subfamily RNA polymerase sigma-70 factor [Idiomarinaceae bacterium HL-53]|nr:MAG: ECF subfamily RNA polymerase sigma-70 factor [Idiomarinaceae bacterium HL-53]CUS48093.1 RNA polymerase sigma-70 factor, ECF subfamily [Idiomarinaceae bacterium HL-53]
MSIQRSEWLQWYPGALALARQLLSGADEAKDIVQSAYIKCFEHSRIPTEPAAQRVWLLKVVRNSCIDYLRGIRKFSDESSEERLDSSATPEQSLSQEQRKNRLQEALALLSIDMREVLVLREMNELSYAQVATLLNIEPGTVMSRLHRARMALRARLQQMNEDGGEV